MSFFPTEEKKNKKVKKQKPQDCETCNLYTKCVSPKMDVYGEGKKRILIITDKPTQREDETGVPYQGETGKRLRNAFQKAKISLKEDCWKINGIRCYKKGKLTTKEINACRPLLLKTIKELKPEKIIVLGIEALQCLIGHRTSVTSISKWSGHAIPDQELGCWVFPVFSPQYVIAQEKNEMVEKFFIDDICNAVNHNKKFINTQPKEENINLITNVFAATLYLEGLLQYPPEDIAFDYETTGLKPQATGHKILCVSFCYGEKTTCFPIFPDKDFKKALRKILQNKNIKKIANNIQFEDKWTKVISGYKVKNWYWDSMIATHVLDNRTGVTGLKFQVYVRYGILEYDKPVEKYIKSSEKSNNAFNQLDQCPLEDLLRYCALDSYWTYKLYQDQKEELNDKTGLTGFNLFMEGSTALSQTSTNGICVDIDYFEKENKRLLRKKEKIANKILRSKEVAQWKGEEEFNFNSNTQLAELLFKILKMKSTKKTAGGAASVDAEALGKLEQTQFIKLILKWKKLDKIQNTYLAGFLREAVNGKIHPNFLLHLVLSFRSSSSAPNFQNIPKRELLAQKIVRTGIIPRPGRQLLEVDYSGAEIKISASHHKDPTMLNYINDSSTDMHRDSAKELFLKDEVSKEERYFAKNNFVFPQFYGSYYKLCAADLWENIDGELLEHLESKRIHSYVQFENHVKKVEDKFWNKRFKVYKQWKLQTWQRYVKNKYIFSPTGFKYTGIMKRNDALNYSIQGSSFHTLLWSYIQIGKWLKENNMKTILLGQIHDSVILDVVPEELPEVKKAIRKIMCEDVREAFPWIIVPLDIEADITEIDGNWSELKKEEI